MRLTQIIEALLFASDAPLTAADLARVDERLDEDTITAVIDELRREYDEEDRSFQVYEVAGGYQLLTRPEYSVVLEQWETVPQSTRLSLPALEVLAIIAYRQPLGRAEVEEIRGVQSAAVLRTLQDRGLIDTVGRAEGLGRPMLYGTTQKFLEHFGFRSLEDLPRPDELPVVLRERPQRVAEGAEGVEGEGVLTAEGAEGAEGVTAEGTEGAEGVSVESAEVDASAADEAAAAEVGADVSSGEEATSEVDEGGLPASGPAFGGAEEASDAMGSEAAADTTEGPEAEAGEAAGSGAETEAAATRGG